MGHGKRAAKRLRRQLRAEYEAPTDPDICECCHNGLSAGWHMSYCPAWKPFPKGA